MFSDYGKIGTELYEFTKPVGHSINGDIEYYSELLDGIKGRILEAGVGTGRMLIPLIEKGLNVDGVDLSDHMLRKCRENCVLRNIEVELFLQNLDSLQLPHKYEAIIMPTGSFNLLPNRAVMSNTLTAFRNHLNRNGKIIVDIDMPFDFQVAQESVNTFKLSDTSGILLRKVSQEIDWIEQKTKELLIYEKWDNKKLIETEISEFILSWYGLEEFRMILEDHGYSNIKYTIGYEQNKSSIITFTAKKE